MGNKSVFIVNNPSKLSEYSRMFIRQKWEIVDSIKDADLVQFTGGEDVIPSLYGELPHPSTVYSRKRDIVETAIFNVCSNNKIPMAGICRGAQLINVLNGGSLWQNVNNHKKYSGHIVRDEWEGFSFNAVSLHHQMMAPSKNGFILGTAEESTKRERVLKDGTLFQAYDDNTFKNDVEVVLYWDPLCLCFQPHPEKGANRDAETIYFYYLREYLGM